MLKLALSLKQGDFSLELAPQQWGGHTGIFGPSGCGKTSLLHAIAGLGTGVTGEVESAGVRWQQGSQSLLPTHQRDLAMVFQQPQLFPHLNIAQNLALGSRLSAADMSSLTEEAGVSPWLQRLPAELSGGQRQRVAICRALARRPRLLLLDEPCSALDKASRQQMLSLLRSYADRWQIQLLLVTHQVGDLLQLTEQSLFLTSDGGQAFGDSLEMLNQQHSHQANPDIFLRARRLQDSEHPGWETVCLGKQQLLLSGATEQGRAERLLRIYASDVVLARKPLEQVSMQNCLQARIVLLQPHDQHLLVHLDVDGAPLLAQISPFARQQLALDEGQDVFAYLKAVHRVAEEDEL